MHVILIFPDLEIFSRHLKDVPGLIWACGLANMATECHDIRKKTFLLFLKVTSLKVVLKYFIAAYSSMKRDAESDLNK